MASWGSINLALNRLVREGVISGFKTNRGSKERDLGLHVIVAPPGSADQARAEEIRRQVSRELEPVVEGATVTVDRSLES